MSEDDWSQDNWVQDDWEPTDSEQQVTVEGSQITSPPIIQETRPTVEEKEAVPEPKLEVKNEAVAGEKKTARPSMKDMILLGIDNGLDMFGKNVKEIFYAEMESSVKIKRKQILDNVEQFDSALEKFFGPGTPLVQRSIGRAILCVFSLPSEAGLTLRTSLEIIRRNPRADIKSLEY